MKGILFILSFSLIQTIYSQDVVPEFYWLGYSTSTEKEIGCSSLPDKLPLYIYIEEKDSLKMSYLIEITTIKFKRNKYQADCSNCHQWFTSKKPPKSWTEGKYFDFDSTKFDSVDQVQWYKPYFKTAFLLNAKKIEKISYLKGLYLSSGKKDSSQITLTIYENIGKSNATKKLLHSFGIEEVTIKIETNFVENGLVLENKAEITFLPSQELLFELEKEIEINKTLANTM